MLAQTPFVTPLNRISVVSCYLNLSMKESAKKIFHGKVDLVHQCSLRHFFRGVSGHLFKETARLAGKSTGLVLKPQLDSHFGKSLSGKLKSDALFAGSLSSWEMVINPADTLRTMWQAGEKLRQVEKGKRLSHLYKGSLGNGFRQLGIWLLFPGSERLWSTITEKMTPLDPHTISGIAVKAFPQSFHITAPIWIFERLKNELQYHPALHQSATSYKSLYLTAFRSILQRQGWQGFLRGLMPKVGVNTILVIGADYLLERGRGHLQNASITNAT